MQNLLNDLTELLSKDDRLVAEGKLLKNKIIEIALAMDADLIKLLLKNKNIKQHFFVEIDGIFVFDKIKFQRFVSNKEFLPDSYTEFKNKIGLVNDQGDFITNSQDVVLAWPYKDCILEGGQTKEDQKRDEIFWNETLAPDEIDRLLAPKVLTGWKRYDSKGEHILTGKDKFDFQNENIIVRGNNLLALYSLYKQYARKVKLIYIDPPYNTGSDGFKYNDSFNHATWLSFMRNRLCIAKNLLRNDGFIFVQCDDNEQAYLKVLMDEIFGIENNRSIIYVETVYADKTLKQDRVFHDQVEQILIYSKTQQSQIKQEFEDYSYDKFCWTIKEIAKPKKSIMLGNKKVDIFEKGSFEINKTEPSTIGLKEVWASGTILDMNSSGRFFRDNLMNRIEKDGYNILYKVYNIGDDSKDFRYFTGPKKQGATKGKYYQGVPKDKIDIDLTDLKKLSIENFWPMAGDFGNCRSEGGVELKSGKKPEKILFKIINMSTESNDLIMDFFSGSGTTAAVSQKMGRKYICIEQLDYDQNDTTTRLKNVIKGDQTGISENVNWKGGGSFLYCELMEWNEIYISKITKAKTTKELTTLWDEIQAKAFLSYKVDPRNINTNISDFKDLSFEDQKRFLIEVLDKNQLYVNYSEIDDKQYKVSDIDKKLNGIFYGEV